MNEKRINIDTLYSREQLAEKLSNATKKYNDAKRRGDWNDQIYWYCVMNDLRKAIDNR